MPAHESEESPPATSASDHYRAAEGLLALALQCPEGSQRRADAFAEATLHAQLALVAIVSDRLAPPGPVLIPVEPPSGWRHGPLPPPDEELHAELSAALTHPPVAKPRRRATPKKKEDAE